MDSRFYEDYYETKAKVNVMWEVFTQEREKVEKAKEDKDV